MKKNGRKTRLNKRGVVALLLAVLISSISFTSVVMAGNKKETTMYCYYTTVEIMPGDTLWSIANDYMQNSGLSVQEYIKEVKRINQLYSDNITSGQYLKVFYYSPEYK